jgi:hypothetical protein
MFSIIQKTQPNRCPIQVFQTVGGAVFVAAAQSAFVNQLIIHLTAIAPNIDSSLVVATGASDLRSVFTPGQMASILPSYMAGLKVAFAISIASAGLAFCLSPFNNFRKINAHTDVADSPVGAIA